MDVELGAAPDGRLTALRVSTTADHGAFDAAADLSKYFTNKAAGGITYRCSFRVTEASYAIERAMDVLADELGSDPVELRRRDFVKKEQFPYKSALGFTYDSGDYDHTLEKALDRIGYQDLLKEQAEKRAGAT